MQDTKNHGFEIARPHELSTIKRTIAVMSGKGGVGKSTVTALIASKLAAEGKNVGVLDGDITGPSIPKLFGIDKSDMETTEFGLLPAKTRTGIQIMSINLLLPTDTDPVIWRGPIIGGTIKQFFSEVIWKDLDILLIDLPPGTGDAPLSVMQSLPLDGVIIVSSPQDVAILVVEKAIKMVSMMEKPILGLVENMAGIICPHCGESFDFLGKPQGENLAREYGVEWLGGLPLDPKLAMMSGKIEEYQSPAEEVITRMAKAALEGK